VKLATRILLAIVIVEALVGAGLVGRRAWRTIPQLPNVELNDPLIMPELGRFAQAAEEGGVREWTQFGEALLGKGFYAHAELAFREALTREPDTPRVQFGLAFSLDRTGRIAESSREYRRVLELPVQSHDDQLTHSHALYAMGRNALRLEQEDLAHDLFRKNADFIPAIYQSAKLLVRSGRAEAALPMIEEVLEQVPLSMEFHHLHYRALKALGRNREAFRAAAMVERSAPLVSLNFNTDYVRPFDQMTGTSRMMKELAELADGANLAEFEEPLVQIREVIGDAAILARDAVDEQLLYIVLRKQQPQRVFTLLAELRARGHENAQLLEAEGDTWKMLEEPEKAAERWQRALWLTPNRSLHRKLAEHHEEHHQSKREYHLGQAALMEGIAEYRRNRLSAALKPLLEATELIPREAAPWYYLGEMHFHLHDWEKARQAYRRCLELRPSHGRAAAKLSYLEDTDR
jgi:tetratricopeptide (TPR) repeat protein